jgi:myo-inositol-1-phosphate synthase
VPLNVELKLEVHDSPNSAGIVIDAVRCCKLGLDRGLSGTLEGPSSYFMKSPPRQVSDDQAHRYTEEFIAGVENGGAGRNGHAAEVMSEAAEAEPATPATN